MKLLNNTLSKLQLGERPALMTHVVLGYPSLEESIAVACHMADCGTAIIELQIPFSDPIADGPTIMFANEVAVANKVTAADCLQAAKEIGARTDVPLLLMSYFNPIYRYAKGGVEGFCRDAAEAGVQGLIVPDVPPEEDREHYWSLAKEFELAAIPLVSPVTNLERMRTIARTASEGFVYCVSTTGTTGARSELPEDLPEYLQRVRRCFSSPLAVGFGISSAAHIESLAPHAEIAIVGSATINLIRDTPEAEREQKLGDFLKSLIGG